MKDRNDFDAYDYDSEKRRAVERKIEIAIEALLLKYFRSLANDAEKLKAIKMVQKMTQ